MWPAHADEVPYIQTPGNVVDAMLAIAEVGPKDYVVDLGSGDGRIVIAAAKQYHARGLGIDYDRTLITESRANAAREGVSDRARFLQQDIFLADFRDATVVTMYLLPEVNLEIRPLILFGLRPGTRVVSHDWDMGDWEPDRRVVVAAPEKTIGLITREFSDQLNPRTRAERESSRHSRPSTAVSAAARVEGSAAGTRAPATSPGCTSGDTADGRGDDGSPAGEGFEYDVWHPFLEARERQLRRSRPSIALPGGAALDRRIGRVDSIASLWPRSRSVTSSGPSPTTTSSSVGPGVG